MIQRMRRWCQGYVKIRISGYSMERFLNLCCSKQLELWKVQVGDQAVSAYIRIQDFKKLRPLVRKSHVRVRLEGRYGYPFWRKKHRYIRGWNLGITGFFLLLYGLSRFIWNISVEGNLTVSRDMLLTHLQEHGIEAGIRKNKISCERLEEEIRGEFPEIIWVSVQLSGTRLQIKIKENEVLSTVPRKESEACDVVAGKSGEITRMIVRQGKRMAEPGDYVEEGQVLVSSELSVKNDNGDVIRTAYVHADADIYAKTQYQYETILPKKRTVAVENGKKRIGLRIRVGKLEGGFLTPAFGEDFWRYLTETEQFCMFEDFYLPVYLTKISGEAVDFYERFYMKQELLELSEQFEENYLKKLLEKGVQIIENSVKIQENDFFYTIEGTVAAWEQIGVTKMVSAMEEMPEKNEETAVEE